MSFQSQATQIAVHPNSWFLGVFLHKIDFPGQTVDCCLEHTIHILKAIVPAVNLAYLGTRYVHPVTHQIFCNALGWKCHHHPKACIEPILLLQIIIQIVWISNFPQVLHVSESVKYSGGVCHQPKIWEPPDEQNLKHVNRYSSIQDDWWKGASECVCNIS